MAGTSSRKAVILNSRQNLRPRAGDEWIVNSRRAVEYAAADGFTIISSVGMNSWEIPLFFASRLGAKQKIYIPLEKSRDSRESTAFYSREFSLVAGKTEWRFVAQARSGDSSISWESERDRSVIEEADIVYPISIRDGGNLEALINRKGDAAVDRRFQVQYSARRDRLKIEIEHSRVDPTLDARFENYLIHWTRASAGAWPGEALYQYYLDITGGENSESQAPGDEYPRSALRTLERILREKKLRGSSRHMRKGISAVAFSALKPTEATALMKWRARFQEMTFEPYGVAIERDFGDKIGIRKVIYGNPEMFQYVDENEKWYFQGIGTRGFWVPEKEYRYIGEIDLEGIPRDKMAAIVWRNREIPHIENTFKGKIYSFYRN